MWGAHHTLKKTLSMTAAAQPQSDHKRYRDPTRGNRWAVKLLPGEYYAAATPEELICTALGSCISACLFDAESKIAGMNHFMLPSSYNGEWAGVSAAARYGNYAMEHLINNMIKLGASKANMTAHIYGGAMLFGSGSSTNVGQDNIKFAQDYLLNENIPLLGQDVGGPYSRKIFMDATTGLVECKALLVLKNNTIQEREQEYTTTIKDDDIAGDVELF